MYEGFYLSSDRWPAVLATVVWFVDRTWNRSRELAAVVS